MAYGIQIWVQRPSIMVQRNDFQDKMFFSLNPQTREKGSLPWNRRLALKPIARFLKSVKSTMTWKLIDNPLLADLDYWDILVWEIGVTMGDRVFNGVNNHHTGRWPFLVNLVKNYLFETKSLATIFETGGSIMLWRRYETPRNIRLKTTTTYRISYFILCLNWVLNKDFMINKNYINSENNWDN